MEKNDYEKLIAQLAAWHETDGHEQIARALEAVPRDQWDFQLAGLYARALNNLSKYQEALDVLLGFERDGREDGVWHFRVGYSLYYLEREAEAAEHFQKAIDYGDDGEDTWQFLAASRREAGLEGPQMQGNPELYTEEEMNCVQAHIEKYFGNARTVFHEIASPDIHVDILVIEPVPGRDCYILVTMGMGAHRMKTPEDLKDSNADRAEILVCLPPDWKVDEASMKDELWFWPLRWLKILARVPGEENTWVGWGHTFSSDSPFAENTKFTTAMLVSPEAFSRKSWECRMPDGSAINFYQMIPLYTEEMQFKEKTSAELLLQLLGEKNTGCVDIHRQNVCKK
jgi:tetratricopeptide (TPR) repeat protein